MYLPETPPPSPSSFANREEEIVNRVENPIMIVDDDGGNNNERQIIENNIEELPTNPLNDSSYKLIIDLQEKIESYKLQLDNYKESVKREREEKLRAVKERDECLNQCEKLKMKVTALVATEKALYDKIKKYGRS